MAGTEYTVRVEYRGRRYWNARKALEETAKRLNKNWDGTVKVVSRELRQYLEEVAAEMRKRHGKRWPGGTTPKTLSKRSGKLIESIGRSIQVKGNTFRSLQGYISVDFPGIVHEFGATIKPKNVKYLTVPLPAALTKKGTPKRKSARQWKNTFVAKTEAGNLIIFQRRGSQVIPLYLLKSSVTIPPRLGLRETVQSGVPRFLSRAMDAMLREIML